MMRVLETVFGIAALVTVVACMPGLRRTHTATAGEAGPAPACSSALRRAPMLCNRVLRDGTAECAICDAANRGCLSSTHIYCATSCDAAECVARPKR